MPAEPKKAKDDSGSYDGCTNRSSSDNSPIWRSGIIWDHHSTNGLIGNTFEKLQGRNSLKRQEFELGTGSIGTVRIDSIGGLGSLQQEGMLGVGETLHRVYGGATP